MNKLKFGDKVLLLGLTFAGEMVAGEIGFIETMQGGAVTVRGEYSFAIALFSDVARCGNCESCKHHDRDGFGMPVCLPSSPISEGDEMPLVRADLQSCVGGWELSESWAQEQIRKHREGDNHA